MLKLRQAKLRRAHLRLALAQGSGRSRSGGGTLREKRLLRARQALSARKEELHQALRTASETEERVNQRSQSEARRRSAGSDEGESQDKGFERAQRLIEARKERLDRQLRTYQEIEDGLRRRIQESGAQVMSLYDPTEITAEEEELEAEAEEEVDDDDSGGNDVGNGSNAGRQASKKSSKASRRAARKGRKGR
jgi:hypothetical protein